MAQIKAMSPGKIINPDLIPKSVEEFNEYDRFIKSQLESVESVENTNIVGLECKRNINRSTGLEKISFNNSVFDGLNYFIKLYYGHLNPRHNPRNIIHSDTSFVSIFRNDKENGYFLPKSIMFTNNAANDIYKKGENKTIAPIEYSHRLFNGHFDDMIIPELSVDLSEKNDYYIPIFKEICDRSYGENKSVCFLSYVLNVGTGLFHAIAIVFWFSDRIFYCGIYDPMYYEREDNNYLWAVNSVYITFRALSKKLGIPLTIYNLSSMFCIRNEKGSHCVQYVIDAEYCSMYSLYFLYLYAKHNFPKRVEALEPVVKGTFIDTPEEIKRNPCKATNKFRLVMMSFILTVLTIISNDINILTEVKKVYDVVSTPYYTNSNGKQTPKPGYTLLHPSMLALLNEQLSKPQPPPPPPTVLPLGPSTMLSRVSNPIRRRTNFGAMSAAMAVSRTANIANTARTANTTRNANATAATAATRNFEKNGLLPMGGMRKKTHKKYKKYKKRKYTRHNLRN